MRVFRNVFLKDGRAVTRCTNTQTWHSGSVVERQRLPRVQELRGDLRHRNAAKATWAIGDLVRRTAARPALLCSLDAPLSAPPSRGNVRSAGLSGASTTHERSLALTPTRLPHRGRPLVKRSRLRKLKGAFCRIEGSARRTAMRAGLPGVARRQGQRSCPDLRSAPSGSRWRQ
jgi:hypothetical protein